MQSLLTKEEMNFVVERINTGKTTWQEVINEVHQMRAYEEQQRRVQKAVSLAEEDQSNFLTRIIKKIIKTLII